LEAMHLESLLFEIPCRCFVPKFRPHRWWSSRQA